MKIAGLRLGGLLDRYVVGLFVAAYATASLLIIGLSIILFFASNLDHFEPWPDGHKAATLDVVRFYVLSIPFLYLQIAPFITVVAGLFTVSRMISHNETVAVMAAGVSAQRLLLPVVAGGVVAALAMFGLREYSAVHIGPRRDALLDMLDKKRLERVYESVWFRDRLGDIVNIGEFRPATGDPAVAEIREVLVTFKRKETYYLQRADRGVWTQTETGPRWRVEAGTLEELEDKGSRRPIRELEDLEFSPIDILTAIKGQDRPLELSFSEIDALARRDPDSSEYQTLLQYSLTFPLANLVLLLVALPMMLGRERGKHLEGLVAGGLLCVLYFAVDFICRALGMEGTLSPLLASWLPLLLFGALGAVLFEASHT